MAYKICNFKHIPQKMEIGQYHLYEVLNMHQHHYAKLLSRSFNYAKWYETFTIHSDRCIYFHEEKIIFNKIKHSHEYRCLLQTILSISSKSMDHGPRKVEKIGHFLFWWQNFFRREASFFIERMQRTPCDVFSFVVSALLFWLAILCLIKLTKRW